MVADLRTQAEALILSANGADDLLTCALRPCNVFGPGDPQLIPLLVNMAKSNWDKVRKLHYLLTKILQKILFIFQTLFCSALSRCHVFLLIIDY